MTDLPADDEIEVEEEDDGGFYPDTLNFAQVYFHPDLGTICTQYGWEAAMVDEEGGIWGYPANGGPPVKFEDRHGKATRPSLHRVQ